jgi:NAD-dependent deacetylase
MSMTAFADDKLSTLADLMRRSKRVAILTGAGMSTESGLPDYRGTEGLWKNRRFEELADIETFRREPVEFWEFYRQRLAVLDNARPNPGHFALAALERAGLVERVITQNIDGLHTAACSKDVLEVHGSLRESVCLACGSRYPRAETEQRADAAANGVPPCDCGQALKPNVILFGEMLPQAMNDAEVLTYHCDLLLCCGSSLAVWPVAKLPQVAKKRYSRGAGALAIINRGPTEADHLADVRIEGATGEVLPELCKLLGVSLDE